MISWKNISDAVILYTAEGFHLMDVPWTVTPDIMDITVPDALSAKVDTAIYHLPAKGKTLVGSAEQSFVYMALQGRLVENTLLMAVTPCFRDEQHDQTHQKHFMKLELFMHGSEADEASLVVLRNAAIETMRALGANVEVDACGDIIDQCTGVELGSYYFRKASRLKWICGTGIAEPRFSSVVGK